MKVNRACKSTGNKGFTLIEAAIVIVLIVVLSVGLAGFIFSFMRAWVLITARDAAANNARSAMNRMVYELRRIKKPQNIVIYSSAEVQFLDISNNTIDFNQTGSDLMRNSNEGLNVLATGLAAIPNGLNFKYLDQNGNETGTKQNIRSVRVRIVLSSSAQTATLESSARIRNVK